MELAQAVKTRRTHKVFAPEPVPWPTLEGLFELARWAPNHHLSNPWRFRVLGPRTLAELKRLAELHKPGSGAKLDRAPTLVVASALLGGDDQQRREDLLAASVAAYLVLLAAHDAGLAGYWRTVSVLDSPEARQALGLVEDEVPIGLLHLGHPRQSQHVPERAPVEQFATRLP